MASNIPAIFTTYLTNNNCSILEYNQGHKVALGKFAGKVFNQYALIKNNTTDEQYYICHVNGDNNTENMFMFSIGSLDKINSFNDTETVPTWYLMSNGYIATTVKGTIRYVHQHIMNYYGQQSAGSALDSNLSVDHINQNKLDNRLSNLRIATQREQNMNTSRVYARTIILPDSCRFGPADIPKLIQYKPEKVYSGATHGQHFIIEIKLPITGTKIIKKSTKRADRSIYYKLIQAIKLRYQLLEEYPLIWPSLDIPDLATLRTSFLDEQKALIRRIAALDIIPRDSVELLDMNVLEFPHQVSTPDAANHPEPSEYPAANHPEPSEYPAANHPEPSEYPAANHPEPSSVAAYPAANHPEPSAYPAANHPEPSAYPAANHPEPSSAAAYPAANHPEPSVYPAANHPEPSSAAAYPAANHPEPSSTAVPELTQLEALNQEIITALDTAISAILPPDTENESNSTKQKIACPDCGRSVVKSTLKRHQREYCQHRVLTEDQRSELEFRKQRHYARVSESKIKNSTRKLSDADILLIRESASQGITQQALATRFEISRQYIADIINGKIKLKSDVVGTSQQPADRTSQQPADRTSQQPADRTSQQPSN